MSKLLTIGKRIAYTRNISNYSQQYIADKTGVSRSLIGQIETDGTKPNYEFLRKFIKVTNTTYSFLIEGKTNVASITTEFQDSFTLNDKENYLVEEQLFIDIRNEIANLQAIQKIGGLPTGLNESISKLSETLKVLSSKCLIQKKIIIELHNKNAKAIEILKLNSLN